MILEIVMAMSCLATPQQAPGISLEETQANLTRQLMEHMHHALHLGDGRRAARTAALLAGVASDPGVVREAAYSLLRFFENTGLPDAIREQMLSRDPEVYHPAVNRLIEALAQASAEHPMPEKLAGWKRLGPESGCPITRALAFAEGPDGRIAMLGDGLTLFDGKHWQHIAPDALRVHKPVDALWLDRSGRTWLGSVAASEAGEGVVGQLRRYNWGNVAYYQPEAGSLLPGRWQVFAGNDRMTAFAEGKAGVWIAARARLFLDRKTSVRPVDLPLPYSPVRWLVAWPDAEDLWVVDSDRVSRFDGRRWRSFTLPSGPPVAAPARHGDRVLIPVRDGVVELSRDGAGDFMLMRLPEGVGRMTSLSASPQGPVWGVTDQGHVVRLPGDLFRRPESVAAPSEPPVVFCDSKGRLWLSRGHGIELASGAPGTPEKVTFSKVSIAPVNAPLVSFAGSGGWLLDATPIEFPKQDGEPGDEASEVPPAVQDLGGFWEDERVTQESAQGVLEALRKTPTSPSLYEKLRQHLLREPAPAVRKAGLVLAASARNGAFFARATEVRELAEALLDDPKRPPIDACLLLLEAIYQNGQADYRRALEPVLFEALVRMGFGEFARPEWLEADAWGVSNRRPVETATRTLPSLADVPDTPLTLRLYQVELNDAGRKELASAGLRAATVLADKRAVLAAPGNPAAWEALIKSSVGAGDLPAANRLAALRSHLLDIAPEKTLKPLDAWSDTPAPSPSPVRWIRRVPMQIDSGLGVLAAGARLWLYDEGKAELLGIDTLNGDLVERKPLAGVRALLADGPGVVAIVQDEQETLHWVRGETRKLIQGLTKAFDGLSVGSMHGGSFYAIDGGLVRVDATEGKVLWRAPELNPGVQFWRVLSERALPVADGADVFLVVDSNLVCVDTANGKPRWTLACDALGTPSVAGELVIVGSSLREVLGIHRKTGQRVWSYQVGSPARTVPSADGQVVFLANADGDVTALNASNGRLLWRRPTDITVRRPSSLRDRATSLLLHNGRLIAANQYGYVAFDPKSGAMLRRLALPSARPLVATGHGVVVETAPGRLVAVAEPGADLHGPPMFELAAKLAEQKNQGGAVFEILRMALLYAQPAHVGGYELLFQQAEGRSDSPPNQMLYAAMAANADIFAGPARRLMRQYLYAAPREAYLQTSVFNVVARSHIERGSVPDAIQAFSELATRGRNPWAWLELVTLRLAAGDRPGALAAAHALAAYGPRSAELVFRPLVTAGLEREVVDLFAAFAVQKDASALMYWILAVSGNSGLFERAKDLLDQAAGHMSRVERAECYAYLLSNAGVARRVLEHDGRSIAEGLERFREMLGKRREALKLTGQAERLSDVERQIKRIESIRFP